jgi:hypothetical protein
MRWTQSAIRLSVAVALPLVVASCAPVRVNSYVGREFDLRRYHTYAWAPADTFSTGDPRLDNNTFFIERVQRAVDGQLRRKGFEKTAEGQPDFLIHYHARVEQRLEPSEFHPGQSGCQTGDCGPSVYDAGTLLIDFIDPRSNQLMWRGWAERALDGVIDNQAWLDETIDDAVTRIMARLPGARSPS